MDLYREVVSVHKSKINSKGPNQVVCREVVCGYRLSSRQALLCPTFFRSVVLFCSTGRSLCCVCVCVCVCVYVCIAIYSGCVVNIQPLCEPTLSVVQCSESSCGVACLSVCIFRTELLLELPTAL